MKSFFFFGDILDVEDEGFLRMTGLVYHNRVFRSFHLSDRSDIVANVVDIFLCVDSMLS